MAVEVRGIKSDRTPGNSGWWHLPHRPPSPRRSEGMRLSVWQCGQGTVIDCEEAMIDLTSLRCPAKPAYVAGLTQIIRKVCVPEAGSPMET